MRRTRRQTALAHLRRAYGVILARAYCGREVLISSTRRFVKAAALGHGALDPPVMSSPAPAAVDAAPGDPVANRSLAQGTATARQIMGLTGVALRRMTAGPASSFGWRYGSINSSKRLLSWTFAAMTSQGKRDSFGIDDNVAPGAGSATIGRIGVPPSAAGSLGARGLAIQSGTARPRCHSGFGQALLICKGS